MDHSNLFIGAGVLVGLGTLAYWLLNREDGAAADRALTARRQKLIRAAVERRASRQKLVRATVERSARQQELLRAAAAKRARQQELLTRGASAKATTRASVVANPSDDVADIMRDDAF